MPKYTTLQDLSQSVQDYYNEVNALNKTLCDQHPTHRLFYDSEVFPPAIRLFKKRLKNYATTVPETAAVCQKLAGAASSGRRNLSFMEKRVLNSYHSLPFSL